MTVTVDLAIELRAAAGAYSVEFRLSRGVDSVQHSGPFPILLDMERLREAAEDRATYAARLTEMLFCSAEIREALANARGTARAQQAALRMRLQFGPGAENLHLLHWELLNLPGGTERISTREDILFSRYLSAGADASLPPAPETLRALAAVAAPADAARYGVAPIDVPIETARAEAGLAGMQIDWIKSGPKERCTLDRLADQIPGHDVLYLVCHGMMAQGTGWLLLDDADGNAARVPVDGIARRLSGAMHLPRIAILVVCESANGGEAMAALAPRLVQAGVPAVIGMQGALTFSSADHFLPVLFRELREDGVIDRSVAVARRAIFDRPDADAPVLLMSLLSGRLWADVQGKPLPVGPAVSATAAQPQNSSGVQDAPDPVAFYQQLNSEAFALEDLEDLCFTLGVDWESIRGQTKPAKARAMIQYFLSRGRLSELVSAARKARPQLG